MGLRISALQLQGKHRYVTWAGLLGLRLFICKLGETTSEVHQSTPEKCWHAARSQKRPVLVSSEKGQLKVEEAAEQKVVEREQKTGSSGGFATLGEPLLGKCY